MRWLLSESGLLLSTLKNIIQNIEIQKNSNAITAVQRPEGVTLERNMWWGQYRISEVCTAMTFRTSCLFASIPICSLLPPAFTGSFSLVRYSFCFCLTIFGFLYLFRYYSFFHSSFSSINLLVIFSSLTWPYLFHIFTIIILLSTSM